MSKITVTTYKRLEQFVAGFADGIIPFLVVEGKKARGKSYAIERGLASKEYLQFTSHITPMENYLQLYKHMADKTGIVLYSDIQNLWKNDISVSLFKALCGKGKAGVKTISYHTSKGLGEVPKSFKTRARVIVECNTIRSRETNEDIGAMLSRGRSIIFNPSPVEMFKVCEKMIAELELPQGKKRELHNFLWSILPFAKDFNLRSVEAGEQLLKLPNPKQGFKDLENSVGIGQRQAKEIWLLSQRKQKLAGADAQGWRLVLPRELKEELGWRWTIKEVIEKVGIRGRKYETVERYYREIRAAAKENFPAAFVQKEEEA